MKAKTIGKQDIGKFLDGLLEEYEVVIAPTKKENIVLFDRIGSGSEALPDYARSARPPKGLLLPQAETLFEYRYADSEVEVRETLPEKQPSVLFGVRPCDARSFAYLDKVFNEARYRDAYFLNRKQDMVVVSAGCTSPRTTCFCNSVGGGPFSTEGSDLLLVDIGEDYVVQVVTERGEKVLGGTKLADATEANLALMKKAMHDAEASMAPGVPLDRLRANLDRLFADPLWERLAEKCISCGICTYLCPTCYCFDIVDEGGDSGGKRIRIWDSCQYPLFTLEASGVNPRPTSKERYRQRIMHKFSYTVDNEGQVGCVGCGRCGSECPVNLDIRRVIEALAGETEVAR